MTRILNLLDAALSEAPRARDGHRFGRAQLTLSSTRS